MKPGLVSCLLLVLATNAFAHRLDEYLQATRIAVATNRIDLFIDLTPGVAVADQLLTVIDKNHDGHISPGESSAYARRALRDIRTRLDEKALTLSLVDVVFPALPEVKGGVGVIRIKATATVRPLVAGNHTLSLNNAHLPTISVYLVNALVPKNPLIKITGQTRDELQKDYRLAFEVNSARQ
jgi:hypothetical protein